MTEIKTFLKEDHKTCDELLTQSEEAMSKKDFTSAQKQFGLFLETMKLHLAKEEEVLFPAIEEETGMTMGPTQIMRSEHDQMRQLFTQMSDAVAASDADKFLGASETLLMLIQQHNLKEEQILYPMADQVLEAGKSEVMNKMREVKIS